jgi:hypothetical protein
MELAMTFALMVIFVLTKNVCFALLFAQSAQILHNV